MICDGLSAGLWSVEPFTALQQESKSIQSQESSGAIYLLSQGWDTDPLQRDHRSLDLEGMLRPQVEVCLTSHRPTWKCQQAPQSAVSGAKRSLSNDSTTTFGFLAEREPKGVKSSLLCHVTLLDFWYMLIFRRCPIFRNVSLTISHLAILIQELAAVNRSNVNSHIKRIRIALWKYWAALVFATKPTFTYYTLHSAYMYNIDII